MDWSQSLDMMQHQGPVYWAAVGAVAAGAALLAGAGWLQLRRRLAARRRPAAPPAVRVTETGYTAVAPLPAVTPTAAAPDPRLGELRDRLASAAARLEALRAERGAPGASGLKTSANRVEYVHRSGRA